MIIKFFSFSKKHFFPVFLLSMIFVWSSVLWTTETVYALQEKKQIELGFPFNFVLADYSHYGNENSFVATEKLGLPWGFSSSTIWHLFFLNIATTQLIFTGVLFLFYSIFPKTQNLFKFLSVKNILIGLLFFIVATFIHIFGPSLLADGEVQIRVSPEMSVPVQLPPGFTTPTPSKMSPAKFNQ